MGRNRFHAGQPVSRDLLPGALGCQAADEGVGSNCRSAGLDIYPLPINFGDAEEEHRALPPYRRRCCTSCWRFRRSEGTSQTFHDLCREHSDGGKPGLHRPTPWIFCETSAGILRENSSLEIISFMSQLARTMLRVRVGALAVLMVPLSASQLVDG